MPKTISIEITESQNYLPNAALHYKKDGTKIYKTVRLLETEARDVQRSRAKPTKLNFVNGNPTYLNSCHS